MHCADECNVNGTCADSSNLPGNGRLHRDKGLHQRIRLHGLVETCLTARTVVSLTERPVEWPESRPNGDEVLRLTPIPQLSDRGAVNIGCDADWSS